MSQRRNKRTKGHQAQAAGSPVVLEVAELAAIVERARPGGPGLAPEDHAKLKTAMDTLGFIAEELKSKKVSLERLRRLLFGARTEKTRRVLREPTGPGAKEPGTPPPGHGRKPAAAYLGAEQVKVPHPSLKTGDCCPECVKGKVYPSLEPSSLVRFYGVAPLAATVYERDRLRCNLCGEVFTAPAPKGVGEKKYDETAQAMVGLLKYGTGLPFNRIEKLQAGMRIPFPASTQWTVVSVAGEALAPAYEELTRQAAQGKVLHNDDTTNRILELTSEQRAAAAADEETDERTGIYTSGIVAKTAEGHQIALFLTGVKHAGENLAAILARRATELPPPIQMCDALSRNAPKTFQTILANCIAHARRRYVEVADSFPEECRYVLEALREVYRVDARARDEGLSEDDRLRLHQTESTPAMAGLERWMNEQFAERKVEPNSGLGEAIRYMQKHWEKLTLFLRVAGAPLDNNLCERALKKTILHRKNSLFYKTRLGARVGDTFMSLIHTAELNGECAFDYLVALLRHPEELAEEPVGWMPWTFRDSLARLAAGPPANG
jgi:transposase